MSDEPKELDYSAGHGSLDRTEALIDNDALCEADGRSNMETSFNPDDADKGVLMSDGQRRPWGYLRKQHEGHYNDDSSERNRKANFRKDAATFCDTVDCTTHQKRRVLYHIDEIDVNAFGQTSTEAIILALIAYVANLDDRWLQREDVFEDLCDSLEIEKTKVKKIQRKVRERL